MAQESQTPIDEPATLEEEIDEGGADPVPRPHPNAAMERRLVVLDREARAVDMARMGFSQRQIADELGYASESGVSKAISRAMSRRVNLAVDQYRQLQLEQIQAMKVAVVTAALEGDVDAIKTTVMLQEREAKLLRMDAQEDTGKTDMLTVVAALGGFHDLLKKANLGDRTDDDHDGRSYAAQHDVPEASTERAGL